MSTFTIISKRTTPLTHKECTTVYIEDERTIDNVIKIIHGVMRKELEEGEEWELTIQRG